MTLLFLTGSSEAKFQASLGESTPAVGAIIYEQRFQGEGWTVVYHSPTHKNVMKFEWNRCYRVSPEGTYVSSLEADKFQFYSTFNNELVWEVDWRDAWVGCEMQWEDDTQFHVWLNNDHRTPREYTLLDVANQHIQEPYVPKAPPLPNLMLDLWNYEGGFYQESPMQNIYVYVRCSNVIYDEFLDTGLFSTDCRDEGGEQVVVYDLQNQEEISLLENDNVDRWLSGESLYYLFWSPKGRYLAYSPMGCGQRPITECSAIRVYDVVARNYLNTDVTKRIWFVRVIDDVIWSPDERNLAFRGYESRDENAEERLFVLDVKENFFKFSETYEFEYGGYGSWAWSPDSQHIAFVDLDHQLIQVNIQTKEKSIIATDVERIIAWN